MGGKSQQRKNPRSSQHRGASRTPWALIFLGVALIAGVGWWYRGRITAPMTATSSSGSTEARSTVENAATPPGERPEGMVWIPGGEFSMGAAEQPGMNEVGMQATTDSRPFHRVYVDGFWMDATEVTNAQFSKFIEATKYVTVAERTPRAEDFPGAPPENLVAGAVVFSPPNHSVALNDHFQWWSYAKGASWRHPDGPKSSLARRDKYPVVQIAYEDAVASGSGPGSGCPRRRSGSLRHEAGSAERSIPGATSSCRVAARWPISIKAISRIRMRAKTASAALGLLPSLRRTPTASTTWPATCGSGSATGIDRTTTPNSRQRAAWLATRKALPHPSIQRSQPRRSACTAAVRSLHGPVLLTLHGRHAGQR